MYCGACKTDPCRFQHETADGPPDQSAPPKMEGRIAHLPDSKYHVVRVEDGWDVYGDVNPSFT